ncbi:hypothetical protein [Niabella hibiscisoli]|uniref:hypothetical protein n=1 Tax=Niabella hibiscisoli TaxID=1825928 RepID=UPI001F0DC278|nr:hypothetical protein [Niabella hibiscisoli]MCH5717269.1 hypothetical protein [Niabella hibiscisoli]
MQVENIGGFAIPFDVTILLADGSEKLTHYSPVVWRGTKAINIKASTNKKIKSIVIDGGVFMDATPGDNSLSL